MRGIPQVICNNNVDASIQKSYHQEKNYQTNKPNSLNGYYTIGKDECTWISYIDAFLRPAERLILKAQTYPATKNLNNKNKQI